MKTVCYIHKKDREIVEENMAFLSPYYARDLSDFVSNVTDDTISIVSLRNIKNSNVATFLKLLNKFPQFRIFMLDYTPRKANSYEYDLFTHTRTGGIGPLDINDCIEEINGLIN